MDISRFGCCLLTQAVLNPATSLAVHGCGKSQLLAVREAIVVAGDAWLGDGQLGLASSGATQREAEVPSDGGASARRDRGSCADSLACFEVWVPPPHRA